LLTLGSDTYFRAKHSGYAARLSAGSVVELASRMAQGELCNALAVTRPPGHHCEQHQSMGFCLLNNVPVAVAALRARLGVRRVLVVDWDVHHGNGTQRMLDLTLGLAPSLSLSLSLSVALNLLA
jgi:acetoin utilization deacetylase AcuC-like enzyme